MFCKRCGTEIKPNESACGNCGEPVKQEFKLDLQNLKENEIIKTLSKNKLILNARDSINYVSLLSAVIALISVFLPYITVSAWGYSESVTLMSGSIFVGSFILLIAAATIALNALKFESMIPGIVILIFEILAFIGTDKIVSQTYGLAKYSMGFYFGVLGAVLIIAAPYIQDILDKNMATKNNNTNM